MYKILFNNLFIRFLQHPGSSPTSTTSSKLCHAKLNPSEQNWSTGGLQMCLGLDESFSWFANQIRCFLWYTIISCYDRCFLFNRSFSTTSCKLWLRVKIESGGAELERLCVGTDAPVFPVLRAMLRHTTTLGQYLYLYNTEILLWQGI